MMNTSTSREKQHKKEKKYFVAVLLTFLITYLSVLVVVQCFQLSYETREFPMWEYVKGVVNGNSDHSELIIIGDSRAKAGFFPLLSGTESINLAIGGSTPVEGYFTLKKYIENNHIPEKLVISYAPIHLMTNDFFWHRTVKYNYLPFSTLVSIANDLVRYNNEEFSAVMGVFKYEFLASLYVTTLYEGLIKQRWKSNKKVSESLIKSRGHTYFGVQDGNNSLNDEAEKYSRFKRGQLNHIYLERLLDLAVSKGVPVYWYTMPFNEASCRYINQEFISGFKDYINEVSQRNGVVVIKDFHCFDNAQFGDASHVYKGARLTTEQIINAVN